MEKSDSYVHNNTGIVTHLGKKKEIHISMLHKTVLFLIFLIVN